jgi:hypothetical protein
LCEFALLISSTDSDTELPTICSIVEIFMCRYSRMMKSSNSDLVPASAFLQRALASKERDRVEYGGPDQPSHLKGLGQRTRPAAASGMYQVPPLGIYMVYAWYTPTMYLVGVPDASTASRDSDCAPGRRARPAMPRGLRSESRASGRRPGAVRVAMVRGTCVGLGEPDGGLGCGPEPVGTRAGGAAGAARTEASCTDLRRRRRPGPAAGVADRRRSGQSSDSEGRSLRTAERVRPAGPRPSHSPAPRACRTRAGSHTRRAGPRRPR